MKRASAWFLISIFLCLSGRAQFTNVVVGTTPNDGTGDPLRLSLQKLNFADNWLKTNLNTMSNYVAARINVTDPAYGAIPDDGTDDTLAIQRAIDAAINAKTSVFFPPGVYNVQPWATNAAVLVLAYSSNPSGTGTKSATQSTARQDSPQYGSILLEGVNTGKRPNRIDVTPNETFTKGAVLKFGGDMSGHIGIWSGFLARNTRLKNLTLVGTGLSVSSIGVRHSVSSSHFELENCTIQHFGIGVDIGGDVNEGYTDTQADFNKLHWSSVSSCDIGVKINNLNGYATTLDECDISCRIPAWNGKASAGATPSPPVNIFGGFYAPLTEHGGILITGLVASATGNAIVVGSLRKITKPRDPITFSLYITNVAATISDVSTGMFALAEKNCSLSGSTRVPTWGVMNLVTNVNVGAVTITVSGNVDTTSLVGQPIYIAKPAIAFYGDHFNVVGAHVEQQQADDLGFGSMIAYLSGWKSTTTFRNCIFNLSSSESGFNFIQPLIYHAPFYSYHSFNFTFEDNTVNALLPKFEMTGTTGVRFKNNSWYCEPLILDHSGVIASGVTRESDSHFLKMRLPYEQSGGALEYRALIAQMGQDKYQQIGGLLKRPQRTVTTAPTAGTSGEVAILETSPKIIYSIGQVGALDAYYDSTAITAGTAAISSGSSVATVTNLIGLYIGRMITIAGAGIASADLTTRILDMAVNAAGTLRQVYLYNPASTTVSAGTISEVGPVIESAIAVGRSDAITSQLKITGGSGGTDITEIDRPGVGNFTERIGAGSLIIRDKTGSRNLGQWNATTSTNALDLFGLLTGGFAKFTNTLNVSIIETNSGANQRAGDAILSGGTLVISNTTVTAKTRVFLTRKTSGGTIGDLTYTLNAGVGFTINSASGSDTSTVSYWLIEVN